MHLARGLICAVLALVLLSSACSASSTSDSQSAVTTTSPIDESTNVESEVAEPEDTTSNVDPAEVDDETRELPVLVWEPCGGGLECGELVVPMDHFAEDPSSIATWSLALVRRPAAGQPVGSIIINPGGPGASGVDFVSSSFSLGSAVEDRFHLIGFDPRGVGASGDLNCRIDRSDGPLPDYQPDNTDEQNELEADAMELADLCLQQAGDEIRTLHTDQVVEDLEYLRMALREVELNFVGLSYGTFLGAAYAQAYPETTGRLILDGVVPLDGSLDDLLLQQAAAFTTAGARLDSACTDQGRPSCPPSGFLATFDAVLADLESASDGEVGPTELAMATIFALYTDELWGTYLEALADAADGEFGAIERLSDFFLTAVDFVPYAAYVCNDLARPATPSEWDLLTDRAIDVAPRFGAAIASELRVCAHWPAASAASGGAASETDWSATAALVIGTTGDAATPLANSQRLHEQLPNSALVVVDAERHTSVGASSCLADIVEPYLLDGRLPSSTVECPS